MCARVDRHTIEHVEIPVDPEQEGAGEKQG